MRASIGPGALELQLRDTEVESLTIDNVPLIQSSRLKIIHRSSGAYWQQGRDRAAHAARRDRRSEILRLPQGIFKNFA
jgi:hypothetical protein